MSNNRTNVGETTHFDKWFDNKYGTEYNHQCWQDLSMIFFLPLLWLFGYNGDANSFKQRKRIEYTKEFQPDFYKGMEPFYRKEGLI